MQLVYRGISYHATSAHFAPVQQAINGQYRGISYQIRKSKVKDAVIKNICFLKYRGINYMKILN